MNTNSKINVLSPQTVDYPNYVINVDADGYVQAEVTNKEKYTKEELDSVRWVAQMITKSKPNFTRKHLSNTKGAKIKVRYPLIFAGAGYGWLEPVFGENQPTNELPNGYFIKAEADKAIQKIEWREYSEKNDGGIISGEKHFGEAVQLHIYTRGLYANKLRVQLKDNDKVSFDDELTLDDKTDTSDELSKYFTRLIRVFKHADDPTKQVQKVIVNIQLERRWEALAGDNISIKPIFTTSEKGVAKPESYPELKVTKAPAGELVYSPLSKAGNQPVIIGDRVTDVAHFHPCRYEKITKALGDESPLTIFSKEEGINVGGKQLNIGAVANTDSSETLTIKVETLDTEDCAFIGSEKAHETTLLNTGHLELLYPDATINQTATSAQVSFVPKYLYDFLGEKDYLAFFMNYFPVLFARAQQIKLPVTTCAFTKDIHLQIYPDVAFAYHLQIGKPEDFTQQNKLYYRQIDVEKQIKRGLKNEIIALRNGIDSLGSIQKKLLNGTLSPIVREILLDYIMLEAEKFGGGFQGYHTFTSPTTPTIMDYGKKYEWIPNTYIIGSLVVSAAIDALILYLTRGRAAATKAVTTGQKIKAGYKKYRKIKRYHKTAKKIVSGQFMDPAKPNGKETEFIWPQISIMNGIGYIYDQEQNTSSLEYVTRVDAAPLFALQHQYKGSLGSLIANLTGITKIFDTAEQVVGMGGMLKNLKDAGKDAKDYKDKKQNERNQKAGLPVKETDEKEKSFIQKWFKFKDIQVFLDEMEKKIVRSFDNAMDSKTGSKAQIEMTLKGFYSASYELKFQTHTKTMVLDFYDENGNITNTLTDQEQVTYGTDYGIDLEIKLEVSNKATQKWSKLTEYIPGIHLNDTRTDIETQGKIKSALNFERTFTYSDSWAQPVSTDKVIFTGIVLTLFVKVKVEKQKVKNKDVWETEVDEAMGTKDKPLAGVLLPGFTIDFDKQPIFENIIK